MAKYKGPNDRKLAIVFTLFLLVGLVLTLVLVSFSGRQSGQSRASGIASAPGGLGFATYCINTTSAGLTYYWNQSVDNFQLDYRSPYDKDWQTVYTHENSYAFPEGNLFNTRYSYRVRKLTDGAWSSTESATTIGQTQCSCLLNSDIVRVQSKDISGSTSWNYYLKFDKTCGWGRPYLIRVDGIYKDGDGSTKQSSIRSGWHYTFRSADNTVDLAGGQDFALNHFVFSGTYGPFRLKVNRPSGETVGKYWVKLAIVYPNDKGARMQTVRLPYIVTN